MRWWAWAVLVAVIAGAGAAVWLTWFRAPKSVVKVRPVHGSDQEIAWLHNPTSYETWENFVWGVKRAEMGGDGGPDGLEVDDSGAYPEKTTAVPEVVIRRKGYTGALRIRWYKVTDDAPQEAWVTALAARDPPPLAILSGWSSDRAKSLAEAMRDTNWSGPRPLCFLAQATADQVDSDDDTASGERPSLISVYDRSFRFCFTNRQMADAVTDFVLSDPTLRPGPITPPGLEALPAFAAGAMPGLTALALEVFPAPIPAFAIEWKDDPYSTDLNLKFREALDKRAGHGEVPPLKMVNNLVPFSTGRLNRANVFETQAAEHILANLPPPGTRTIVVIPTVTTPARRTLRELVRDNQAVGRQLVAITGDGLGVNAFLRDREFAWPVRSIPIPFVQFTHADPMGWDAPGSPPAPPGYELIPPKSGAARSSTEDIRMFTLMTRVIAAAAFPAGTTTLADTPDAVAERLRTLDPPFFDAAGNRLSGTGEHVVLLRPGFPGDAVVGKPHTDATLEVYGRRSGESGWTRLHTLPLARAAGGQSE